MRSCLIVWVAFFLSCGVACASGSQDEPPLDMTYCQLAKDPSAFTGRRIRIRAIYVFGFEVQVLKSPVCCPVPEPKIGVEWDADMDDRSEKLFRRLDKGMGVALAIFVGRLSHVSNVSPQIPSGERFQLNVEKIDKVEKTTRSKHPLTDPEWARKDCATGSFFRRFSPRLCSSVLDCYSEPGS